MKIPSKAEILMWRSSKKRTSVSAETTAAHVAASLCKWIESFVHTGTQRINSVRMGRTSAIQTKRSLYCTYLASAHPMYTTCGLNRPGVDKIEDDLFCERDSRGREEPGQFTHKEGTLGWMVTQAQDRWMLRPERTAVSFSAVIYVRAAYTLKSTQSS
jgi:hypothetical protein